jgi:pre-mRNA-splicing factor SYF1
MCVHVRGHLHLFEARDISEEAIESVLTVRDFTQVFDAYAQSEEGLIKALMNRTTDDNEDITEDG